MEKHQEEMVDRMLDMIEVIKDLKEQSLERDINNLASESAQPREEDLSDYVKID